MSALLRVPAAVAAVAAAAAWAAALPGFGARLDRFIAAIGLKRPLPMGFGLWLAIFPQAGDAQGIARCAAGFCCQHRLSGALQPAGRRHITWLEISGGLEAPPQLIVDAVNDAAARIPCPPIRIVFDRVMTFFASSSAFVLRGAADSDASVGRLRQMLAATLKRRHLQPAPRPRPRPSSTPHMTTMYGVRHAVPEQFIEPIAWTADRFALVLSHVRATHHQRVREWPLR